MSDRITHIIDQIKQLEDELNLEFQQQQEKLRFTLNDKKVKFEHQIYQIHRKLKVSAWKWLFGLRAKNLITAPIIYSMIIPLLITDLCVSLYHADCFPIYKITKVQRSDYIAIDRHQLAYLNIFEKFHCIYCGYATGLIAYIQEIIARTEQYFCPIKHARKLINTHYRYRNFIAFGDADNYHQKLERNRQLLAKEK